MQKLPEASVKKKEWHMRKEKGTSQQKEEAHSLFQQWPAKLQNLNLPTACGS